MFLSVLWPVLLRAARPEEIGQCFQTSQLLTARPMDLQFSCIHTYSVEGIQAGVFLSGHLSIFISCTEVKTVWKETFGFGLCTCSHLGVCVWRLRVYSSLP